MCGADDRQTSLRCGPRKQMPDGTPVLLVEAPDRLVHQEERDVGREHEARLSSRATDDAIAAYQDARIAGFRSALAILALLTVVALFLAQRIPTVQPGREIRDGGIPGEPASET